MIAGIAGLPWRLPDLTDKQCPAPATCECECHDKARMPIGPDIGLLCEAVTWAVRRRRPGPRPARRVSSVPCGPGSSRRAGSSC
jgi:hypothetical protein